MQNINQLLEGYKQHLAKLGDKKNISSIQTALLRFTVPGWGGTAPKGARSTTEEIAKGLEFLSQTPVDALKNALEVQEKVFVETKTPLEARRQPRYHLNNLINWAKTQGYLIEIFEKNLQGLEGEIYKFKKLPAGQVRERLKTTNRRGKYLRYSIGSVEGDFLNEELKNQFLQFDKFQEDTLDRTSKATHKKAKEEILKLFGWVHRYKTERETYCTYPMPLKELNFETLIPVIDIDPRIDSFNSNEIYWMAQIKAKQDAEMIANNTEKLLCSYFDWRKEELNEELSFRTKVTTLDHIIVVAKFLYRNQTNRKKARNFEDIPVVKQLQLMRGDLYKKYKKFGRKISCRDRMIPWSTVIKTREMLRKEADMEHTDFYDKWVNKNRKVKRPKSATAKSMQLFLLLAFLTVAPPDRQRTFRELELGRTLKHGLFIGEQFIHIDKMNNKSEAKWYIHLGYGDYKTSKSYGEWIGALPDEIFPDGSTFYGYLDKWFYHGYQDIKGNWHGWRKALNPKLLKLAETEEFIENNYVFIDKTGIGFINENAITRRIKTIFEKFTGVSVTPHLLRAIFRTHLIDIGASLAEQESAAYWMKHDIRTAADNYTFQERSMKLNPAANIMQKINQLTYPAT